MSFYLLYLFFSALNTQVGTYLEKSPPNWAISLINELDTNVFDESEKSATVSISLLLKL